MRLSEAVDLLLSHAAEYAREHHYEYLIPEMLLLMLLEDRIVCTAVSECGGDPEALAESLAEYIEENTDTCSSGEPELSNGTQQLFSFAATSAVRSGADKVHIRHLLHAFFFLKDSYAAYFLREQGIEDAELLKELQNAENETFAIEDEDKPAEEGQEDQRLLSACAPCLNETLKNANPLIGRKAELDRTIQILCRKEKNNPLHIGEPGVGKTAITCGLVELIRKDSVPDQLKGAKVFALDLGSLLAGTQYRGEFEKRFKKILSLISREEKPIIYIDEIHNLAGAGAVGESSFDASNLLKPYLTDQHIRFIGATTYEEYKKYFEKNRSLVRRFQNVDIGEPSLSDTVSILNGLKGIYERYHGIRYTKGVLEYIAEMSQKHINDRFLPDKAIDLMDEAGAYRKLHPLDQKTQSVGKDVVNEVLTGICRIPPDAVRNDDSTELKNLEGKLRSKIFGQDEAVRQVVNAVKFSKAGLIEEGKPLASLLFAGPTGVGKTEIARCLAAELGRKLIRFDMSEYGEKHTIAKLIGSPAGYVGYDEGGLLTEAIRKTPSAVLLLDEIEKAHPDIYGILLQVMDYATLTDNQGRKADFRNVILIMTSNAGASSIGKTGIGFAGETLDSSVISEEINRIFQPEFRNRLNKIVIFNGMDDSMAQLVAEKKLHELQIMLERKNIRFTADNTAVQLLKTRGTSRQFGAREIDRIIRNEIKPLFVDEILFGKLTRGGQILLTAENDKFKISAAKMPRK